jgi:hypothetical protein
MLEECYKHAKNELVEFIQMGQPLPDEFKPLEKKVSAAISRVVQKHVADLFGPKLKYEGKRINATSIRVDVVVFNDADKGGYHGSYNDTVVFLDPDGVKTIIKKLAQYLNDEDVDIKREFESDLIRHLGVLEILTHEVTHLLQSIRASTKTKKGLHGKALITNVGRRGEYEGRATGSIGDRLKYTSFPLELEAYAAASATALVRHATRHMKRGRDPQAWNDAVDNALKLLNSPSEAIQISANFGKIFNTIKEAIAKNEEIPNSFKQKEIARIWKRFLKMTYIQVMSHKEKI